MFSYATGQTGSSKRISRPPTPGPATTSAFRSRSRARPSSWELTTRTATPPVSTATKPNNSATDSGAAYVFVREGTNWSQQAYLKASNTGANDWFGWRVAVSGDTVVVGAKFESGNATGVNGNQGNNSAS